MTKCIQRIRDLFEYALYKFTLYLLTYSLTSTARQYTYTGTHTPLFNKHASKLCFARLINTFICHELGQRRASGVVGSLMTVAAEIFRAVYQ